MGLVDIIKKLFNKKSKVINRSNNKDIISYNTSAISLPKYSKLPKEAKEKVNEYIEEINIEELESLVKYGNSLYEDASDNTKLLLNLLLVKMTPVPPKCRSRSLRTASTTSTNT